MARALSIDLRRRVIAAIVGGLSCRQAAERFGVSPSTAIRWYAEYRASGSIAPKPQGGDRRSARLEAAGAFIVEQVAERPDLTLRELQEELLGRGLRASISTIWRLLRRRRLTFKKRRRMPRNRAARTSKPRARLGPPHSATSMPEGSSSSTRPAPIRKWRGGAAGRQRAIAVAPPSPTGTGRPRPSPPGCAATGSPRR